MEELACMIVSSAAEIDKIAEQKSYSLEGHLESYKLLETLWLLDNFKEDSSLLETHVSEVEFSELKSRLSQAIYTFKSSFDTNKDAIISAYNQEDMEKQAEDYMTPWTQKVDRAQKRLQKMKHLHSIARRASDIFQGHNFIKKAFILRKLRKEAGFKLRRNRVCNFAAKTFDLVNEAQVDLNQANNGLHNSNVKYKCIGDLYSRIYQQLQLLEVAL